MLKKKLRAKLIKTLLLKGEIKMKKYENREFWGMQLSRVVEELVELNKKGKLISTNFNGVILYSDTVTMDDAYVSILGKTKREFDDAEKQRIEKDKREQEEYKKSIPELTKVWVEEGKKVLSKDKWDLWEEIVPIRLKDLYRGMELRCCLDIVKVLNNGTFEEAKTLIEKQNHSGMSFRLVCSMVREFSPRGSAFVNFVR